MKKFLVSLVILALCAPAMAATEVNVAGGAKVIVVTVTVTDPDVVRGLALTVEQSEGDTGDLEIALDGSDWDVVNDDFNTNIDYFASNGTGEVSNPTPNGEGHPIAQLGNAGEIAPTTGVQDFAVSTGYLDASENQGGLGAGVYTITINMAGSLDTDFDIALDTYRGGCVGDDVDATLTTSNGDGTITVTAGIDCFSDAAGQKYTDWVNFNRPDCWCYEYQCRGDADDATEGNPLAGFRRVFNNDLAIMLSAYDVKEPPQGPGVLTVTNGICADFDHAQEGNPLAGYRRVFNADLAILLANYDIKDPPQGTGITICPLTTSGGDIVYYKYATP